MSPGLIKQVADWVSPCTVCRSSLIDSSLLPHFKKALIEVERAKHLIQYRCERCKQIWVYVEGSKFASKVKHDGPFSKWLSEMRVPTGTQKAALAQIGGIFSPLYGDHTYPCEVRAADGAVYTRALIVLTGGHAFSEYMRDADLRLLTPEDKISRSPFALKLNVREASSKAVERKMGFAPCPVRNGSGKKYTLTGPTDFFDVDGVKGEEIELDDSISPDGRKVNPSAPEVYLVGDP